MRFQLANETHFLQLAQLRWDWRAEDKEIPRVSKEAFTREFIRFLRKGLETNNRASDEAIRFYERAGFKKENEILELKLREY